MKKLKVFIVVLFMCMASNIIKVNAQENNVDDVTTQDQVPDYNDPDRVNAREEKMKAADEYMANRNTKRDAGRKRLDVPVYAQDNNFYCGPASVQMVVKYKTGVLYGQSTLARDLGTTGGGTNVGNIPNVLKAYTGLGYEATHYTNYAFTNALVTDIEANCPIIINVNGYDLNSGYYGFTAHYIVGNGYSYWYDTSGGGLNVNYMDPNTNYGASYQLGEHVISSDQMIRAIASNTGYYIW